jgi:hypothetical protein
MDVSGQMAAMGTLENPNGSRDRPGRRSENGVKKSKDRVKRVKMK